MSLRSITLGLTLGLAISSLTYFNDWVMRQTMLIGNFLPISVFGVLVLLVIVINPLLRRFGPRWPLTGPELLTTVAVSLVCCGWPGSNFYRHFEQSLALPAHWNKTEQAWQANAVLSYVPGASPRLAPGHVRDWDAFAHRLADLTGSASSPGGTDGARGDGAGGGGLEDPALRVFVSQTDLSALHATVERALADGRVSSGEQFQLLQGFNDAFIDPVGPTELARVWQSQTSTSGVPGVPDAVARHLADAEAYREQAPEVERGTTESGAVEARRDELRQGHVAYLLSRSAHAERHANRAAVAAALPKLVVPAPEGISPLVAGGMADPVLTDGLLRGQPLDDQLGVSELPWYGWWDVMAFWWPVALLAGIAALSLSLIVHPQWSRRELLSYPIARFVDEVAARKPNAWLPTITRERLFWVGFIAVVILHLTNGLHTWNAALNWIPANLPEVPQVYSFGPLRQLFPNASRISVSYAYFAPRVFPLVVAFAFFLTTSVSFSLGISTALFLVMGSVMLSSGVALEMGYNDPGNIVALRVGAFVGITLAVLYTGRRHYLSVLGGSVGLRQGPETPAYSIWAGRVLGLSVIGLVVLLTQAGLAAHLACLFVLLLLMIFLVLARVVAETGLIFAKASWFPVAALTGLFGFEAIGPTGYVLLGLASIILVVAPREVMTAYTLNALQMAEKAQPQSGPRRAAPWLVLMIVAGFVVAGVVTMWAKYNFGVNGIDGWGTGAVPKFAFGGLSGQLSRLPSSDALSATVAATPIERLGMVQWRWDFWGFLLAGLALVLVASVARLRLPWWPIHPILFIVWGTFPMSRFAVSFLLGWAIKSAVMNVGGARGFQLVKPLMVGVIAGELIAGLGWMAAGWVFFFVTGGQQPPNYSILPG